VTLSRERAMSNRIIRRFGGGLTYALRRKNSLSEPLKLSAAALAGATSATVTGTRVLRKGDGTVKKGATFTVAGVAGTYTVAADATVTGNPLTITFAPVLAGPASQNAAVTWSQPYAEHSYEAMNGRSQVKTEQQLVADGELVRWLLYSADLPAPAVGDALGGLTVQNVEPIGAAGVARYKVTVGAAS
jgi:hypothetical protein